MKITWVTPLILAFLSSICIAQSTAKPQRLWSVSSLTESEPTMGFSAGPRGATITGPQVDSQTRSTFAATHSMVLAGDRLILASRIGLKRVEGAAAPAAVYEVLSLDVNTGGIKNRREFSTFASIGIFGTNDAHVIVSGRVVERLTPELKVEATFDYHGSGHKFGNIENASPDGSTLGNATLPGFELVSTHTLTAAKLTADPAYDTSVSSQGFVTDNIHWVRDYPKESSFVTYTDAQGQHLIYHGACGGRPQFLTEELILEPGCKSPLILNTQGKIVRTLPLDHPFSYAGVSQDGQRLALQVAKFSASGLLQQEQFVIYSVETGQMICQVDSDVAPEAQSWTAFSSNGLLFAVGSPSHLTLYRLP